MTARGSRPGHRIVRRRHHNYNILNNMKTIAITIDDVTLALLDELSSGQPARKRSALVRAALREYAERERRRVTEQREGEVFRKNRTQLTRQARALIREQARS